MLAAMGDWIIVYYEVETAYLYGSLKENIYMKVPSGLFEEINTKGRICKLKQVLYGLWRSGRIWYQMLSEHIELKGIKKMKPYKCIFKYE